MSDEQIHRLEQDSGTTHLPEYIAAMYGGMFVPLARPEVLDNVDLYSRSVKAAAKRGMVDQIIAKALDDGVIEPDEANAILTAHRCYMSARFSEVLATILLHTKGTVQ